MRVELASIDGLTGGFGIFRQRTLDVNGLMAERVGLPIRRPVPRRAGDVPNKLSKV